MPHVKSSPFSSIQNLIKFAKQFDYLPLFSKHNGEYIFFNFSKNISTNSKLQKCYTLNILFVFCVKSLLIWPQHNPFSTNKICRSFYICKASLRLKLGASEWCWTSLEIYSTHKTTFLKNWRRSVGGFVYS